MVDITDNFGSHAETVSAPALRQQGAGYAGLVAVAPLAPCQLQHSIRILRLPEVMARVGICRASIYSYMAEGSFPKSVSLGARAVGWLEHEIDAWLVTKIQARKSSY
jgi:prophage regulatory protein